jgi:hypothetical protein
MDENRLLQRENPKPQHDQKLLISLISLKDREDYEDLSSLLLSSEDLQVLEKHMSANS